MTSHSLTNDILRWAVALMVTLSGLLIPYSARAEAVMAPRYEYDEITGLRYYDGDGATERHVLNLVIPKTEKPAPLLMWIPGGAWAFGERAREMPVARRLAREGIAVAVIDHRMSPASWVAPRFPDTGVTHPAHINDSARAFAWLAEHADKFGYDVDNLFVGGFSSGAHLSALLVMDNSYLDAVGVDRKIIRAAVPVSGAYDMARYYQSFNDDPDWTQERTDAHVLGVFGTVEALGPASPNQYLNDATIPMLVLSESETEGYTKWFEEEVAAAGLAGLIQFKHFPDQTHRSLFLGLANDDRSFGPRRAIMDYIKGIAAAE